MPSVEEWARKRGLPWNPELVPPTMVHVDDLCAAFVYFTNSRLAYLDSAISNPDANPYEVLKAAPKLFEKAVELTREYGYGYLACYTDKFGRFFKGAVKFAPNAYMVKV